MEKAYLIRNIEAYGKLIAYCLNNDILVFRAYWDERKKGNVCYSIDFRNKRLFYSDKEYYLRKGYEIITPIFKFNEFGNVYIEKENL